MGPVDPPEYPPLLTLSKHCHGNVPCPVGPLAVYVPPVIAVTLPVMADGGTSPLLPKYLISPTKILNAPLDALMMRIRMYVYVPGLLHENDLAYQSAHVILR